MTPENDFYKNLLKDSYSWSKEDISYKFDEETNDKTVQDVELPYGLNKDMIEKIKIPKKIFRLLKSNQLMQYNFNFSVDESKGIYLYTDSDEYEIAIDPELISFKEFNHATLVNDHEIYNTKYILKYMDILSTKIINNSFENNLPLLPINKSLILKDIQGYIIDSTSNAYIYFNNAYVYVSNLERSINILIEKPYVFRALKNNMDYNIKINFQDQINFNSFGVLESVSINRNYYSFKIKKFDEINNCKSFKVDNLLKSIEDVESAFSKNIIYKNKIELAAINFNNLKIKNKAIQWLNDFSQLKEAK